MEIIRSVAELIETAKKHEHILIFGAGFDARKMIQILKPKNITTIDACLVSEMFRNQKHLYGVPVVKASDKRIPRDMFVIVSVGYAARDGVLGVLKDEGYTNIAAVTQRFVIEVAPGRDRHETDHVESDPLERPNNEENVKHEQIVTKPKWTGEAMNEALYAMNVKALKKYRYCWQTSFPRFDELNEIKPIPGDTPQYVLSHGGTVCVRPDDEAVFAQAESDMPIIIERCYAKKWLMFICDRLRTDDRYGADNHLYLFYPSRNEFFSMLSVVDFEKIVATDKVVFLLGDEEKRLRYPLRKGRQGDIKPLEVGEINTIIHSESLKHWYSGNFFLNTLLDYHPCLLSSACGELCNFDELYDYALKGKTVDDVKKKITNPKHKYDEFVFDSNFQYMFFNSGKSMKVGNGMGFESRIFKEKLIDDFFRVMTRLLPDSEKAEPIDWFKAIYIAYAGARGRKFTQRLVPMIYYDWHSYPVTYPRKNQERDNTAKIQEYIYSHFKHEMIYTIVRDPLTAAGSRIDTSTPKDKKSYEFYKTPLDSVFGVISRPYNILLSPNDSRRENWRVIRFEDLKMYPHETLKKICEFFHLPWSDTLLKCTICGEENDGFMGTSGFDTAPIYKKHDKYFDGFDRYRAEYVHQNDYTVWGYKLEYYTGMKYTLKEIRAMFSLPWAAEKEHWGKRSESELVRKIMIKIAEDVTRKVNNNSKDDHGEEMVLVEWLKPDIPEGAKLYE